MSDKDSKASPSVTFDVSKIHAFSEIPLGHFSVIQTKVASGKRLTAFMTKDRVKAFLLVDIVDKAFGLVEDEVIKFLAGCKISPSDEGRERLNDLVHTISKSGGTAPNAPIVIAEGTPPIDGEDAKVAWKVEIAGAASDDDPSRIKHDESAAKVDHREVRKAITVNAGDMILSITPPTLGQSGRDIFGKILPAKDGRAKDFDCGEGVRTNEHRTEFFALETGHVAIENQRITVSPVLKVPAVDFNSGNIEYKGRVEVAKDVNEGFKVTAGAEIAIGGDVKDATLKAGKTISAQAFLGKQCKVEAEGDIRVARIVNATVHGKSRLTVMREILNSSIQVTGGINAPEASFVGGEIICLGPVYIGTVGSHTDTAASQRIVIDPAALTIGDLAELTEKIKRFGEQLEKIKAGLGPIAEQRTLVNRLPSEKKGMVTKLIDNLDIIGMHKAMAEKELKEKTEPFNEKVKATVFVKQIYPGTKITLMGVSKIFNEAIPAPMAIALDRATKAIKITPWLKKGEADLG